MPEDFEYDVAFSFLAEDEELVIQIADLIGDAYDVFVYSRAQERLVGSDGEEEFNRIFQEDGRVVVVIYREGWGDTSWTRIEETAIKNRGYEHGYDSFLIVIPAEQSAGTPDWLPRTIIYHELMRFGVEGAAAVIRSMIQRRGGDQTTEGAIERARRLDRRLSWQRDRERFLNSADGVQAVREEFDRLAEIVETKATEMDSPAESFDLRLEEVERGLRVVGHAHSIPGRPVTLSLFWLQQWSNSLEHSRLGAQIFRGLLPSQNTIPSEEPVERLERRLDFDAITENSFGWRDRSTERFYSSEALADLLLTDLIDELSTSDAGYDFL